MGCPDKMTNPYSKLVTQWESSGSVKGDFLQHYACQALELLKSGESVKFSPDKPRHEFANEEETTLSFLSGGTTSGPEVVKHTSATMRAAVNGLTERIGGGSVNSVCCLPLWHVGGWMQLERAWATGGKILFCDYRDLTKRNLEGKMDDHWISLVPSQLQVLLQSNLGVSNLKKAKGIFVGGAGMNVQQVEACRDQKLNIFACYGSSETAGMVTLLDSDLFLQGRVGVGTPLPHAEIRINEENGRLEIKSTSMCISRGEKKIARDSWLLTPDIGHLDHSGNFSIKGRTDRIINTGGEKVHPFLIEQILYGTGMVEQCMVYGEPDEKWGQRVVACVCPESIDLNRLRDLVADKLVGPMKPKSWETMEKLPFSEMGKLPGK